MNITTPPVAFLPTTAAQPTDVLRRDNAVREVVTPLKPNEAFHRERGLGSDSERRAQSQERSYAQQLAQARIESGFPAFLRRPNVEDGSERAQPRQDANNAEEQAVERRDGQPSQLQFAPGESIDIQEAYARSQLQRDDEPLPLRFADMARQGMQFSFDWEQYQPGPDLDPQFAERGRRIEQFYQGSFRPNEQFLLGVA